MGSRVLGPHNPDTVYDRLLRLAADIDRQRERSGRAYANVPQTEQGDQGAWTPIHAVISRALDEFEGHPRSSRAAQNGIPIGAMEQHHAIRCAVNDNRKEIQNVAAKHADVQYFAIQTGCIGAAKRNPLTVAASMANSNP